MFDALASLSTCDALNAVHHAIRVLQGCASEEASAAQLRRTVAAAAPTAAEVRAANSVVRELEETKGLRVAQFSPEDVEKSISRIADYVLERVKRDIHFDPRRGHALLERMKETSDLSPEANGLADAPKPIAGKQSGPARAGRKGHARAKRPHAKAATSAARYADRGPAVPADR